LSAVLSITFPIFACIGLGYFAVWRKIFAQSEVRTLGKFVMNFGLPALLFNALAQRRLVEIFEPAYVTAYCFGSLCVIALAFLWFKLQRVEPSRFGVAILGSVMPNNGYMGYPILLLAHPKVASQALAMNSMTELFVIMPVCLAIMAAESARKVSVVSFLRDLAVDMLKRPMIIGILLGLAVSLSGLTLPSGVTRLASVLGTSTAPLALFFIGGSLAGLEIRGNRLVASQIVFGKLFIHPALVALVLAGLPVVGLTLDPALRAPLVLSSSMPMLGIYAILAAEKGHAGMASIALLAATVVSFFTISGLLSFL